MKRWYLIVVGLFPLFLFGVCEQEFVDISSCGHDFELVHSTTSQEWSNETAYLFKQLPFDAQTYLLTSCVKQVDVARIWALIAILDDSYQSCMNTVESKKDYRISAFSKKCMGMQSSQGLHTWQQDILRQLYYDFLINAFDTILHNYVQRQPHAFAQGFATLGHISSDAQQVFKDHVYRNWPYSLNKYATMYVRNSILKTLQPKSIFGYPLYSDDERVIHAFATDYGAYDLVVEHDGVVVKKPLKQSFSEIHKVFLAAIIGIWLPKVQIQKSDCLCLDREYLTWLAMYLSSFTMQINSASDYQLKWDKDEMIAQLYLKDPSFKDKCYNENMIG